MDIFGVIRKWELDRPNLDFNKFSRKAAGQMADDIQNCYLKAPPPSVGRFNQSLHMATEIVEGRKRAEELALPLLFSKQVMLPDPLYSLLAPRASALWNRLPEGGNKSYSKTPLITSPWKNYWSTDISERFAFLNATLSPLVAQMLKLQPMVDTGHILLQPWEVAVESEVELLRKSVADFQKKPDVIKEIAQRFKQAQYSAGVRLGPIGLEVSDDSPSHGLLKGDPMWFGDKAEILVMGLIHSIVASKYSSSLLDALPGDRLVYDYVRTGGILNPKTDQIVNSIQVPNLSEALWDDIIAIKNDSELLNQLKDTIAEVAYCNSDDQKVLIKEEIAGIASKLKADTALKKYAKFSVSDLGVGLIAGAVSNAMTGSPAATAATAAAVGAGLTFGGKLVSEYFGAENESLRRRRDVIVRINHKL
ncbi:MULTISPECIES: hypothetical protein [Paraburkholderia]|uniref:Uncharacterized protein n=1 Tax=Paraburkholderia madseniana TaxID=2599607 RepID=A0AAP5BIZ3_9BURK|nr:MULTISPECIES: hypothetical protein [Paraburkholderia]MCX4149853.1 hypothetical protein [Paraburkholderia madseniana]MDN7152789.1 hypothetical protein [Paraburkholderia sp. WS6]MDQ6411671.1 hypothetical protein [Paraburkholderia madseniana]